MKIKSVIGQKFNRLTVVAEYQKNGRIRRKCVCECGGFADTTLDKLKSGRTKSCGCAAKGINRKHGEADTRLYKIYLKMVRRCYVPKEPAYKYYGARGITICDEWLNDSSTFFSWARKNGYSDELTIDRLNVNGNYEPSNCRWATMKEQALNRRSNHYLELNGIRKTIAEWSEEYNINRVTVGSRLERGWSVEKALTYPVDEKRRNKSAKNIGRE